MNRNQPEILISSSPHIDADELGRDDLVDVAHGLEHALPAVHSLVPVAELERLVDPRGRPAGHRGAVEAAVAGDEIDLDGGVPAAVHDLPRADRPHRLRARRRLGGRRSGGERRADGDGAARRIGRGGEEWLGGGEEEVGVGHVSEAEGAEAGTRRLRGYVYMAAVTTAAAAAWGRSSGLLVGRRRRGGEGFSANKF